MSWSTWARRCLDRMDALGMERPDERAAFEQVERRGCEPYYTLKGFAVLKLNLDDGEP